MKLIISRLVAVIAAAFLIISISGCLQETAFPTSTSRIRTYREIPGITDDEIAAIAAIRETGIPLVYASSRSTELFERHDGELGGYTALLCEWLSGFFDLPIRPAIQGLSAMLENLSSGEISFATLSATPERREAFFMTDVAQRSIIMLRIEGSQPIAEIKQSRLPRYIFTEGSVMMDLAKAALEPGSYEPVIVTDEEHAYTALISGEGDAFIATNTMEAAFDHYSGVYAEEFLPLIFLPAAMTASNEIYEPIISLLTRSLEHGVREHLSALYRQGYQDYRKHRFEMQLTPEELDFLRKSDVIPYVTMHMAYPISFYNTNNGQWEGIVFDVLDDISQLTGINFKLVNDNSVELPELLHMVESGVAHFMPNMILTSDRYENFIFPSTMYLPDRYVLISKLRYPIIELNDIPVQRVGVPHGSAFSEVFRLWFPDALYISEYPTTDDAFAALDRGEVDLVMSSQSRLSALTNYYEFSDYKANYIFTAAYESTFGFNTEQTILCSIIDKALPIIDTERIVHQWNSRTYNIETMRLQAQRPWLISATVLSLAVLSLVLLMSHRKRNMMTQLQAAVDEARDASRAKSDFLAKMSHEIRTPMNAIIGLTELALRERTLEAVFKHTTAVKQAGIALSSIIDDILDFSKIEAGNLEIVMADYFVSSLINDVISIVSTKGISPQIRFSVNADPMIPAALHGDEAKIRQALLNVLSNALKYTQKGFVSLTITGSFINEDTVMIIFEVEDSGRGIKEKDISNLFKDFTQFDTEKNKGIEGVGLGLAITNSIVNAMGGSISVRSEYGKGSLFTIALPQKFFSGEPLAMQVNPAIKRVQLYEQHGEHAGIGANPLGDQPAETAPAYKFTAPEAKILIVDDIKTNLHVARGLLLPYNMQITTCTSGMEALEAVKSKDYDLIFMDHKMPEMDGVEVTEKIRKMGEYERYYKNVPIVALTANAVSGIKEMLMENGFNDFLSKPIDTVKLNDVLEKWLPQSKQIRS